jgi:general stress protein 26
MTEHTDEVRRVADLLDGARFGMFTTTAPDGTLMSRPMALQETEFDGDLWFYAERGSRKLEHIDAHPQVNVAVSTGSTWVSLTGDASMVEDAQRKRDLWNAGVEAWFPDGPDDPKVVLIRVDASSAEYWDTPGGRVASLISFAKAKATGTRYSGGENERVEM